MLIQYTAATCFTYGKQFTNRRFIAIVAIIASNGKIYAASTQSYPQELRNQSQMHVRGFQKQTEFKYKQLDYPDGDHNTNY